MRLLVVGLNPSVYSADLGHGFARPGNRFGRIFNAASFVPGKRDPSKASVLRLLREGHLGFTDIVRRATDRADQVTDDDYRRGARVLKRKLLRDRPAIAWFQGVTAFRKYLEFAEEKERKVRPGLQPERIGATLVFVTPNPSGANPAANPKILLPWYRKLRSLRDRLRRAQPSRKFKSPKDGWLP